MDLLIQEWNFRVLLQQHLSQILDWQKKLLEGMWNNQMGY
jgi:predicted ATPase